MTQETAKKTVSEKTKKSIFYKLAPRSLKPFLKELQYKKTLKKWSHNYDSRSFDWDWRKINFNRIALVNLLLNKFENPDYLEIGCASNDLFDAVSAPRKVGVDPASGGNVRKTSDAFFESNKTNFDVIFIDGLHEYEQVRRDIINSLKSLKKGGWIALHDMLPINWLEHHLPIISRGGWTGDVWKNAFELIKTDGIEFKILRIDHGVGVIKVLDPSKAVLPDFRKELLDKQFSYYYDNINKLPIVEWKDAQEWLNS